MILEFSDLMETGILILTLAAVKNVFNANVDFQSIF